MKGSDTPTTCVGWYRPPRIPRAVGPRKAAKKTRRSTTTGTSWVALPAHELARHFGSVKRAIWFMRAFPGCIIQIPPAEEIGGYVQARAARSTPPRRRRQIFALVGYEVEL